ncbi:ricin B lectin domain-containing protein [Mycena galericulata]|nr:ricin B lectin domain-containing protein [Mycena galericulata]
MFSPTLTALLIFTLSAAARLQGGQRQMQSRDATPFVGQLVSAKSTRDVGYCLGAESNENGAAVAIVLCGDLTPTFPNGNNTWVVPAAPLTGSITTFGDKCLDVTNGNAVNGQTLQIWTCTEGDTNQLFLATDAAQIQWVGTNFCVDLTNGDTTPGNLIQIWDCAVPDNSNPNQVWIFSQP